MSRFAPQRIEDIASLIRSEVLGLVTTHDAEGFISTPLPLLAEIGEDGEVRAIIGHFAKANPHVARAQASPQALISFLGPHGYIGPAAVSKPGWGPTWNYALAQFEVEIDFQPDKSDAAIRLLVGTMEGHGPDAWTVERMGERYERLVQQVIAFRARVVRSTARFKLGQDEDPRSLAEIVEALGDTALENAMLDQCKPD
jgi:transcriptional regulator